MKSRGGEVSWANSYGGLLPTGHASSEVDANHVYRSAIGALLLFSYCALTGSYTKC